MAKTRQAPPTPLCAEIVRTTEEHTDVRLELFGRPITLEFQGQDHYERAVAWVQDWAAHLDHNWMLVRQASAGVMDEFAAALQRLGVDMAVIAEALEQVRANVEG